MTFAEECDAAAARAEWESAPFTPSPAQQEAALQPLVTRLLAVAAPIAERYIKQTYRFQGLQPVALRMYKEQLK